MNDHHPPTLDTHQHLWDLSRFRLPWLTGAPKLDRSYVMDDYVAATQGLGVVRAVYMEVDVAPEQQVAEAEYVVELCRRPDNPMAAAVISGRPAEPGFAEYLDRWRGVPEIKGLRQVLHGEGTPAGYCLQPEFIRGMRLLGERGLSFDLCMRHAELSDGTLLIDRCPDTRFILDHCGNPPVRTNDRSRWEADLAEMARRPNVVCKVSGIVASVDPERWSAADLRPIVEHVLREFGPARVMFGGDWPVCTLGATYRQWVDALREIVRGRPYAERAKLFHDNAARFYGLDTQ
jgi:L-fuconolactonase